MNNSLLKWDPFKEWNEMQKRLSGLHPAGGAEGAASASLTNLTNADWQPAVDISEDDTEYLITADLPEVKKDEVHVGVENGVLTIEGERRSEAEQKDEKKKFHRIERSYGRYVRTFRLPEDVHGEKISAEFKDGVLRVHLPKGAEKSRKRIDIS